LVGFLCDWEWIVKKEKKKKEKRKKKKEKIFSFSSLILVISVNGGVDSSPYEILVAFGYVFCNEYLF
jgi:hypothetical protein